MTLIQWRDIAGLRTLYDKYSQYGFELVAFPCNQFGRQAPGTSQEERAVAWRRFGLEFPVFDKIDVNGSQEHPIYRFLKSNQTQAVPFSSKSVYRGPDITWNFEKFLCDRNGVPVKRYKPAFDPLDLEDDLRLVLGGRGPTPPECAMHPGRIVCRADYDDLPPR